MWQDLSSQPLLLNQLRSDVQKNRVAGTYLFIGGNRPARRKAALELAKAINCLHEEEGAALQLFGAVASNTLITDGACGACRSCRMVEQGDHPDVFMLDFKTQAEWLNLKEEEALRQKELRIESCRMLMNRAALSPAEAKRKFFIIDGTESLSTEAANALLKSLEETGSECHWILLAESRNAVLSTLVSRSRVVALASEKLPEPLSADNPLEELHARMEQQAQEALALYQRNAFAKAKTALDFSARIAREKSKVSQRDTVAIFLKALARQMQMVLRRQPIEIHAVNLEKVLTALSALKRNAAANTVLDALFLNLESQ